MKLKDIVAEGKTRKDKLKKPRAKAINDVLKTRKGGAHHDDKKDYVRAKEKQKLHKEMNEADDLSNARELYKDARQHIRDAMNHMNFILSKHFDRGARYETPDRDTVARLARAAAMVDNAAHTLAAGTPDDKQDAMDV